MLCKHLTSRSHAKSKGWLSRKLSTSSRTFSIGQHVFTIKNCESAGADDASLKPQNHWTRALRPGDCSMDRSRQQQLHRLPAPRLERRTGYAYAAQIKALQHLPSRFHLKAASGCGLL